jgi:Protein of unknown function (DUF4242)
MPRYMVERNFPDGLSMPTTADGTSKCLKIVNANADEGVTWVHSYVSADNTRTFCVYESPTPEAIRHVGRRNGLPVDNITEVSVLDPYFYLGTSAGSAGYSSVTRPVYRAPWRPFRYFL